MYLTRRLAHKHCQVSAKHRDAGCSLSMGYTRRHLLLLLEVFLLQLLGVIFSARSFRAASKNGQIIRVATNPKTSRIRTQSELSLGLVAMPKDPWDPFRGANGNSRSLWVKNPSGQCAMCGGHEYGCGSKLSRGKLQVLVHVSTYQGKPFWN